jgi:drug/metabolite transporter (DMT)-like permease
MKFLKASLIYLCGIVLGASGPSVFMLAVNDGIEHNLLIVLFLFTGAISMFIIAYWKDFRQYSSDEKKAIFRKLIRIDSVLMFLIGGFALASLFIFYVKAMNEQSVSEVAVLVHIRPLFATLLAGWILKEKIDWFRTIIAICLSLVGILMICKINLLSENLANSFALLAIAAAFFGTLSSVLERKIQELHDIPESLIAGAFMLVAGSGVLIWTAFAGKINLIDVTLYQSALIAWLGIGTVGVSGMLRLKAYKMAGNFHKTYLLGSISPIFSCCFAYILLHERIDIIRLLVGFLFIVVACIVVNKSKKSK